MIRHAVLGLALLAPAAAPAQSIDYGSIDGFLVPAGRLHTVAGPASARETGAGLGLRVLSRATDSLVVLAETEQLRFDSVDAARYRVGGGLAGPSTSGLYLTYDRLDYGPADGNAFGIHSRLAGYVTAPLLLYGSVGYLGVDADGFFHDGFDLNAGAAWDFTRPWSAFVDYRALLLDDRDSPDRLRQTTLRIGVRFRFDC